MVDLPELINYLDIDTKIAQFLTKKRVEYGGADSILIIAEKEK